MTMQKYFQWGINAIVLYIFIVWMVVPFLYSFVPYYDDTLPDETIALDDQITEIFSSMEPDYDLLEVSSTGADFALLKASDARTPLANQDNYAASRESVVYISVEDIDGWQYYGAGSILSQDGLILTNYHVIEGAMKIIVTTASGEHYPVTDVVALDDTLDVAFLDIDAEGLAPLVVGDSDAVTIGDEVLVLGHPEGFLHTLSVGNVSGRRSYASQEKTSYLQITNPISMGNSGGAALNQYGEIIGVPTWSVEYDNNIVQVQNLNFAVPINDALAVLERTN